MNDRRRDRKGNHYFFVAKSAGAKNDFIISANVSHDKNILKSPNQFYIYYTQREGALQMEEIAKEIAFLMLQVFFCFLVSRCFFPPR
jgi:hypothetical protein